MQVILIDDEPLALDLLEVQLNNYSSSIKVLGKFTHFNVQKNKTLLSIADVVFLDIEMPEVNGIELAKMMLEQNPNIIIVFVTAYENYAVSAFEINVTDYLLKPIQAERLKKTLDRVTAKRSFKIDNTTNEIERNDPLHIGVCNTLSFQKSNDSFEKLSWRTNKAKELFLYLLQHRGKVVPKSKLIDILWPDFEADKAYPQLYTTIYHIRNSIKPFDNHFVIKSIQDGYVLFVDNILIDIVTWEEKINSFNHLNDRNIEQFKKAMKLYTGPYLNDYDFTWVEQERYRYEKLWLDNSYLIAQFYTDKNELETAEKYYMKITEAKPDEEKAHFSLMKIYATFELGLLIEHQYEQLNEILKAANIDINPTIKNWYDSWRSK